MAEKKQAFPEQQQEMPGHEEQMSPRPRVKGEWYTGCGKLMGKIALITGADSGIGQSVAIFFAREGADIVGVYYNEHDDARRTKELVSEEGRTCELIAGDVKDPAFCRNVVELTIDRYKHLDILVNNAAYQHWQDDLTTLPDEELDTTFKTNVYGYFYMAREALKHMRDGDCIINTASITAYMGNPNLIDYSATKGAIVAFTRSLSVSLEKKGIRVNAVAPGPVWTPLIPGSFPAEEVAEFGQSKPMGHAAHPEQIAPCYVFLAARDSQFLSGQVLHPNGGAVVNG